MRYTWLLLVLQESSSGGLHHIIIISSCAAYKACMLAQDFPGGERDTEAAPLGGGQARAAQLVLPRLGPGRCGGTLFCVILLWRYRTCSRSDFDAVQKLTLVRCQSLRDPCSLIAHGLPRCPSGAGRCLAFCSLLPCSHQQVTFATTTAGAAVDVGRVLSEA